MSTSGLSRTFGWSFALAAITALALLLIGEASYHRSIDALNESKELYAKRAELARLLRYTLDIETGQRGFLLTGKDYYLKPYTDASELMGATLAELTQHYRKHPEQLPEYERVAKAVETKLSEVAETVQLYRDGRHEAWNAILQADIGKESQDVIRNSVLKLVELENTRLQGHEKQVVQTLLISRLGVATLTVLSLLAFYFYLRQARELIVQRERQRAELQTERDQLENEVRRRTEELTVLARHLQTTQEAERSHLARELHDELGALFTSAKLDVARLQAKLPQGTPDLQERLKHLNASLNSGIELKRRIIEDLRPSALGHFGLSVSLDILTREFAQRSGLVVDAQIEPLKLGESRDLTVYRFVQEALTNIAKYAKATRVDVRLAAVEGGAQVTVSDDGVGFDPWRVRRAAHGISGMRFRVEAEGGEMTVDARPGAGCRLVAWLPDTRPAAVPEDSNFAALNAAGTG
jgi:signal transduction histidine kinase